jgi:hypothetical protein
MYRVKILFVYLLLKTNFYLVEAVEAVEDNLSAKAAGNKKEAVAAAQQRNVGSSLAAASAAVASATVAARW